MSEVDLVVAFRGERADGVAVLVGHVVLERLARAQTTDQGTVEAAPDRLVAADVVVELRIGAVALRVRVQVAAAGAAGDGVATLRRRILGADRRRVERTARAVGRVAEQVEPAIGVLPVAQVALGLAVHAEAVAAGADGPHFAREVAAVVVLQFEVVVLGFRLGGAVHREAVHPPGVDVVLVDRHPGTAVAGAVLARGLEHGRGGPDAEGAAVPAVGDVDAGGAVVFVELGVEALGDQGEALAQVGLEGHVDAQALALDLAVEAFEAVRRDEVVGGRTTPVVVARQAHDARRVVAQVGLAGRGARPSGRRARCASSAGR